MEGWGLSKPFENKVEFDLAIKFYDSSMAQADKGEWRQAMADFNRAIEIKSDDPVSYHNRAVLYYGMKDFKSAKNDKVWTSNWN